MSERIVRMADYLAAVDEIAGERPEYRIGGDGSDGGCDCIGLTIGAIRRAGGAWPGLHGSNYAARNETRYLLPVTDAEDLTPGECVCKARAPGEDAYDLPDRYQDDPDRNDYYHWGVVRSATPLEIIHCTAPGGITVDRRLGRWRYRCGLARVEPPQDEEVNDMTEGTMRQTATVRASSGSTVNLRKTPGGDLVTRVPVGATVTVTGERGEWSQIEFSGRAGWMMSRFLDKSGGAADGVEARVAALEEKVNLLEERVCGLEGGVG